MTTIKIITLLLSITPLAVALGGDNDQSWSERKENRLITKMKKSIIAPNDTEEFDFRSKF